MVVQEVIRVLESHGWQRVPSSERCCQLRHDSFPGAITLVGKPEIDVPIGVLRSLWKWARIEEQS